jgi:hypothetical protein
MLFIGLDVSKISTALCIEKNGVTTLYSYTTKKDNNTWVKQTSTYINYRHINYNYSEETDYSKSELLKLLEFDTITDLIINDIFDNIKILDSVRIGIEGFSYNSTGPIFDLIEFTTLLKYKLMKKMNKYSIIEILSPMTIKSETCKAIYKPRIELKGKRVIKEIVHIENDKGKQANQFDKWDMFFAFLKSDIKLKLKDWCVDNKDDITKGKEVPKPIDDLVDAILIKEIIKRKYFKGNN